VPIKSTGNHSTKGSIEDVNFKKKSTKEKVTSGLTPLVTENDLESLVDEEQQTYEDIPQTITLPDGTVYQ